MPTNVWDSTFPPDTQLANLLGSDLRNFRLDVQQRMGLISGTLATRWNPGTDVQPLNWTGLLYFTTDTNQVFQWSGAAWVDVTSNVGGGRFSFVGSNIVPVTVANTVALSPLQGVNVGANAIGPGQTFYMDCSGVMSTVPASTFQLFLYLDNVEIDGGNGIGFTTSGANNQLWSARIFFTGLTTGVAGTIQRPSIIWMGSPSMGGFIPNSSGLGAGFTIDTTSTHVLQLKVQWGTANAGITITQNTMTVFRAG